eukprot:4407773-Amphidinium_carterae.1
MLALGWDGMNNADVQARQNGRKSWNVFCHRAPTIQIPPKKLKWILILVLSFRPCPPTPSLTASRFQAYGASLDEHGLLREQEVEGEPANCGAHPFRIRYASLHAVVVLYRAAGSVRTLACDPQ